ncbi:MAG: periplasmic heavy metal sensor [Myxococcales bacterium]|nr:periplasmic heavy metal sensor [Myxococcales bacterium]
MFGFAIGFVSLCALIAVVRRGRHFAFGRHGCGGHGWGGRGLRGCGSGWGGGCGGGHAAGGGSGWGGWSGWDDPSSLGGDDEVGPTSGGGGPFWLRAVLARLETTPTQRRAIVAAAEEFGKEVRPLRDELRQSQKDLAAVYRGAYFDESVLGHVFGRHDEVIERFRRAAVGLLGKVHEVLDEEQRARLAKILEAGVGRSMPRWI